MRRLFIFASCLALLVSLAAPAALAQEPEAAEGESSVDQVSEQASSLEAQLSKLRDTSADAGNVMLKLVDLYHEHGRVFGLIRIGERFVANHPDRPEHADVMVKVFDGMVATSRNKDVVVLARQFLGRYIRHPECARIEAVLARTLDEMGNTQDAAKAYEAHWRRNPGAPDHRRSGLTAMSRYASLGNAEGYTKSGEIGEMFLDTSPKGSFATEVGWYAFTMWRSARDWARANVVGNKLLQKSPPSDTYRLRLLHEYMAQQYGYTNQYANAVNSWQQVRKLQDTPQAHRAMILDMHRAAAKAAEIEREVNQYFQKYPERDDRWELKSYVALAYIREENNNKALAVIAELLPHNSQANSMASRYVQLIGMEDAQTAKAEQTLKAAISQNERDPHYLRYVLALNVYRDRMEDVPKARQVVRQMITQSPADDTTVRDALKWLLYSAPNDAEFRADVQAYLKTRLDRVELANFRGYLSEWINEAKKNKEHKDRAQLAQNLLQQANQQPLIQQWIATEGNQAAKYQQAREKILENAGKLSDDQAWTQYYNLAYNYRRYGNNDERAKAAATYAQMAKRFPKRYEVAVWWLETASDYAPPEAAAEAAKHLMSFEPRSTNTDLWRRLMAVGDRNESAELVKQSYAWIQKAIEQHGFHNNYADYIGDTLKKYGMEAEGLAYWKRGHEYDLNTGYSINCATRLLTDMEPAAQVSFYQNALKQPSDNHGWYACRLANHHLSEGNLDSFEKIMRDSRSLADQRPFRGWGADESILQAWVNNYRSDAEASAQDKARVFSVVRDMKYSRPSATATLALFELPEGPDMKPLERLLTYQRVTTRVGDSTTDWDRLYPYAQAAVGRNDYLAAATLLTGMISNIPAVNEDRQQAAREMVALTYSRLGSVGLAIDESSPIAPLLQAALYLRLGDERMAFETYAENQALFDEHRNEVPVDLILFVCDNYIAGGGDENHDRVEDILRGWLVAKSEKPEIDDRTKARVQLMLAKNFFKARRYDVARSEYTTAINRYPDTPEAIEAQFGIGETFMAQKVYDQAEAVFEKLANSRDRSVMIRAEFLRGVLANRRGDREEARDIFRAVLERVPSVELANQALFNLSEIYGAEQRYMDQLELLRTVGRLGQHSKRAHSPGVDLSVVVQDPDLAVSKGHRSIPVSVTTEPGGDNEQIDLFSGGAGKGLFRADLRTELGSVVEDDGVLQLTGNDVIRVDYPEEFKKDFRTVIITDTEIRVASNAVFDVSSSKIVDQEQESFSQRLERTADEEDTDQRVSQGRPANQVKPGNQVHLRVKDYDRDLTDQPDKLIVKLEATSGDQAQIELTETEPHSGVFEGSAETAELPAGALASDTAIDHSPLMAIDQNPGSTWRSEPDAATPKWLTVDMKELRDVDRVKVSTPNAEQHAPVRGELQGSHDGRFWFRLGSVPPQPSIQPVSGESAHMTQRVYAGNYTSYSNWNQIVDLSANGKPVEQGEVDTLSWNRAEDAEDADQPYAVLWHGKLVQRRSGAARLLVTGNTTALVIDGRLELSVGKGGRSVDVWLDKGIHDLTVFSAFTTASSGAAATIARADYNQDQVTMTAFRPEDFDLESADVEAAPLRNPPQITVADGAWDFRFDRTTLRHVRVMVHEYLGEAVAINQVEVYGDAGTTRHIPTEADVLSLAQNDILEIAAGDMVTASYMDEFTQTTTGRSRLLTGSLQATYYNASVSPITYAFSQSSGGGVSTQRLDLLRIDPGDRFIVEVTDYDQDRTDQPDVITLQVSVNDGEPVELTATETSEYSGVFTKEVDTSATEEEGKLLIQPGDRVYISYLDPQNTFPGHAVPRESVVLVNQPSDAKFRIIETRLVPPPEGSEAKPQVTYVTQDEEQGAAKIHGVAFEAPLTVEVIDPDRAKNSGSSVKVRLQTTDGAKLDVRCELSTAFSSGGATAGISALEQGRFVGQVILQLGGKDSPQLVPQTGDMPSGLIGGPIAPEDEEDLDASGLVTRVLNLTGKDVVIATYSDELRPDQKSLGHISRARLIANGTLACTDREYEEDVDHLHVGEKMFLRVVDPDRDVSDERDVARVEVTTDRGEQETVEVYETLAHSGIFTGSVLLKSSEKPMPGDINMEEPELETYFGDTIALKYIDEAAGTAEGTLEVVREVPVVIGTDGLVAAFSKTFQDETLAVETQFRIAESYFELFKSHKNLGRVEEQRRDLQAGRRVLREVMEDYPNPKYTPRIAYLLGQFAQELEQWDEAITAYQMIVRQYPEHTLAPDAQYKLAQCYEESGSFDEALEAYVTLAATYPQSPLIANVMIRICDRFYKLENYEVAAQVGEKFADRFDTHQYASRMAFRVGQCYYKDEQFGNAADAFDEFAKVYPDDDLSPQALFWAGEAYRLANNNLEAFRRFNRCRWDFPRSDAAKYARGRLTRPEMLRLFEQEARSVEMEEE